MRFTSFSQYSTCVQYNNDKSSWLAKGGSQSSNEKEARAFIYKKLSFAFSIPSASYLRYHQDGEDTMRHDI